MKTSKEGSKIKLMWKSSDPEDVDKAKVFFTNLTRQGWFAATCADKLERVLEFKPGYKELFFIPPSEGG
ncbi:MAG: hypothetical protein ABSB40_12690 [Nitrososphaeria archaeon]|jgi:hypothetical protein